MGCEPLSQVRGPSRASGARSHGPARSCKCRTAPPRGLRSRLRRGQHLAHSRRAIPDGRDRGHRFVGGNARQGAQPDARPAYHVQPRRPRAFQTGQAARHPLQQRRLSLAGGTYRHVPRSAEAAALGRPARDPDAAQPRSAVACADAHRGRGGAVARQAHRCTSTGLRPFLDLLAEPERTQFYETYAALTARAYPTRADGITIFPFRRLFIVARRA
jgi:hypothetical protein